MTENTSALLYGLDDNPGYARSTFAAFQHVLASFIAIITPSLVIGAALGLDAEIPYLISMSLMVSGFGTFIQARRVGKVGSGLMAVQGTSFAFLSAILAAGFSVKAQGAGPKEILATIFTVCAVASFIEIGISFWIVRLKRIVTPIVTGVVITTIGLYLITVGMTDVAGGFGAANFGSGTNVALGLTVLVIIIIINRLQNPFLRLSSILIGMAVGYCLALFLGLVSFEHVADVPLIVIPVPFKYGLAFSFSAFVPIALIFVVTAIESTGDLTATSIISRQPTSGPLYMQRIRGGLLADGVNSFIAGVFNTFPNTTFSQNNGVIQLTGVASRRVAFYIAGMLILLGLFPFVGAFLQTIPKPVLGGATIMMFGTVAASGIRLLASANLGRKEMSIIAVSLGLAFGVSTVPEVTSSLPPVLRTIFSSPITVSGLSAIAMTLFYGRDGD